MIIKKFRTIELQHRAYHFDSAQNGIAVIASEEGDVSVIDLNAASAKRLPRVGRIKNISIDALGRRMSIVESELGVLKLMTVQGTLLSEYFSTAHPERLKYQACRFAGSGDRMLAAAPDADRVRVELLEANPSAGHRWSLTDSVNVELPFVDCECILSPTSDPQMLSMFNGAGQDGEIVHWLNIRDSKLNCDVATHLDNVTPPEFTDGSMEFFAVNHMQGLHRFEYPSVTPNATCEGDEQGGLYFTECFCLLGGERALVTMNDEIFRVCDTRQMTLGTEVILEGYSDISFFHRMGEYVAFVRRKDCGKSLDGWQDELLLVATSDIG